MNYFFNKKILKISSVFFLFVLVAGPFSVLGAEESSGSGDGGGVAEAAAGALGGCTVGQIAANIVGGAVGAGLSAIGTLTGKATGYVENQVVGKATNLLEGKVPVISVTADNKQDTANSLTAQQVRVGVTASADSGSFFDAVKNILDTSSLDSIGFCIANEIIHYIAQSTIQWIKSGFKGSPVFVDNTNQFFQNIADQELGNFANGLAEGTLGINLCEPFKIRVVLDTLSTGNNSNKYGNRLNCTLSKIKDNYENFTNGNWNSGGFPGWFELIEEPNNIYGASYEAQRQALININKRQNTATVDLNWSKGYKSFEVCDRQLADGSDDPASCRKVTPGQYIEHQINERGASGMKRLYVADEFDEVVTALVNQLIKIAIDETFKDDGGTSEDSTAKYEEKNRELREKLKKQIEEQQREYIKNQNLLQLKAKQKQNNASSTATTTAQTATTTDTTE